MVARTDVCAPDATTPAVLTLTTLLWSPPAVVRALGIVAAVIGFALALWSLMVLGAGRFFGRPTARARFVVRGPYRRVRHPFYCGALLLALGLFTVVPSVAVGAAAALVSAAMAIAIRLEEHHLVERFGEAYRRYRAAVPCLLPLGWYRARPPSDASPP